MDDSRIPRRPEQPIVVPVLDEPTHLPPYYFCSDVTGCRLCRESPELLNMLIAMLDAGEIDGAQAIDIYWGQEKGDDREPTGH